MCFENKKDNTKIKIWDSVKVILVKVDMELFKLFFELV
jgi:hypothetical protein